MPTMNRDEVLATVKQALNQTSCLGCRIALVQHHVILSSMDPAADMIDAILTLVLSAAFHAPHTPGFFVSVVKDACALHHDTSSNTMAALVLASSETVATASPDPKTDTEVG